MVWRCFEQDGFIEIRAGTGCTVTADDYDLVVGVWHIRAGDLGPFSDGTKIDPFNLVKSNVLDLVYRVHDDSNAVLCN